MPHRPSILKRAILILAFLPVMALAQIAVRNYVTVSDQSDGSPQVPNMQWHQAETVQWDIFVQWRDDPNTSIPTNANPVWQAWLTNDLTILYINVTGTVVDAASGQVRVSLTSAEANMSTNTYESAVSVWLGTTNMGTVARNQAMVKHSPNTTNVTYVGTSDTPFGTNFWYIVTGDTLEGNMNAGGFAITNAGAITSTGTITGNLFSGDGGSLTNLTATATLTPWTGQVNATQFALTNLESVTIGSNTTAYIPHSPFQIRGRTWSGGAITTNHLSSGYSAPFTQYAIPTIAGEDAGLAIFSEKEGGHGSFLQLSNLDTNDDYGTSGIIELIQTNAASSNGELVMDNAFTNRALAVNPGNVALSILTNKHTVIGGTGSGGGGSHGATVYGAFTNFSTAANFFAPGGSPYYTDLEAWQGNADARLQVGGEDATAVITSHDAGFFGSKFSLRDIGTNGVYNNDWNFFRSVNSGTAGVHSNRAYIGFVSTNNPANPHLSANIIFIHDQTTALLGDLLMLNNDIVSAGDITTSGTVDGKDIAVNAAMINEAEVISADWTNTANPWVDNEVANILTITTGSVITMTGTVTATAFAGDGSGLTGVGGSPIDGRAATGTVDMAGNILTNAATIAGTNFVIGTSGSLTGADTMTLAVSQLVAEVISPASGGDLTFGPSGSNVLFSANVILNSNLNVTGTITGPGSGITAVDAATLDTLDSLAFIKADGSVAMSGAFNVGNNTITNLATPTANDHATTKAYVDAADAAPPTNTAVYGIIYIHDGSVTQTIEQTYTQVTGWTTGEVAGVTASTSNITVAADGSYLVIQSVSCQVDANNETLESAIHIESAHRNEGEWVRDMAINTVGAAPGVGVFTLSAGDVIDLRMRNAGSGTAEVLIEQAQLFVGLLSSVTAGTNWAQYAAAGNVNLGGNTITNWGATTVDNNLTVNSNLTVTGTLAPGAITLDNAGGINDGTTRFIDFDGTYAGTDLVLNLGDITAAGRGNLIIIDDSATDRITLQNDSGDVDVVVLGGLTAASMTSADADPADAGYLRLGNADLISWESSPASTDVTLTVGADEVLAIAGGAGLSVLGSVVFRDSLTNTTIQTTGSATGNLVIAVGDVDDAGNGAKITFVESTKLVTITSTAQDAALQVNGTIGASGDVTIDGDLNALVKVETTATNRTWSAADLTGVMVFVTGTSTQTLSNVTADGHSGTFQAVGDFTVTIDPNAADYITLDGTIGAAGGEIASSGSGGDLITIISSDTTNWMTVGRAGTWGVP